MKCPRCNAENADHARFCAQCGQALVAEAAPFSAPQQPLPPMSSFVSSFPAAPDANTAFLLELILGLFGLMGVGWMYAGQVVVGVALLVGWFVVIGLGLGGSILTACLGLCLWIPIHIAGPIISAIILRKQLLQNSLGSLR